jgi:hypothetical protein
MTINAQKLLWKIARRRGISRAQALPAEAFFGRRNEVKVAAKAGCREKGAGGKAQRMVLSSPPGKGQGWVDQSFKVHSSKFKRLRSR